MVHESQGISGFDKYPPASAHYLGEHGNKYFDAKFNPRLDFGRRYQLRYFRPFCGEELDLLDFGCADALSLRTLPARRRIGVDVNPTARQKSRELAKSVRCEIEVHSELSDVPSESVDVAMSNHCLEHVPRPLDALIGLHRVLRPSGRLVVVVPMDDWREKRNRQWRADDPDHHLYTWSPANLGNLVQEAQFHCEKLRIHTFAWSPKMFWLHRYLGDSVFRLACWSLAAVCNHRELFCLAVK